MIYIHVPFCRSFCTYCDFYSEVACKGRDKAAIAAWADGVCEEVVARQAEIGETLDLDTLYIGGGTPSVLPLSVLRRILDQINTLRDGQRAGLAPQEKGAASPGIARPQSHRYAEFTIEVNPEDVVERGEEYVRGLLELGVTRISMGVQSLDDGILRWMNRRHSADGARTAFKTIRAAAGEGALPCDVSVDLITGVPGMTLEILERTVEEVIGWRPEHISAYQLSIEEGSELARMIERGEAVELDEEECRGQYDLVCGRLAEAGYHHYEISNWALPGHEAIHNSAYWTRHPYVGPGPGAHSLAIAEGKQMRSWNSQKLSGWTMESETLTPEQIHTEEIMLLARTDKGPIPERDWFIADEIIPDLL